MPMKQDPQSPWDAFEPHDIERWGEVILDEKEQRRWSQAIFLGGLTYMWRKASVIRQVIYEKLDLRPGDRVLIIGEVIEGSGFPRDMRAIAGEDLQTDVVDIVDVARRAYFDRVIGRGGQLATWKWDYTDHFQESSFDSVAVLQGVQHTDDWTETAQEFTRILKPGRPVVLGEISFGPRFEERLRADMHISYLMDKIFDRMGFHYRDMPYYGAEDLHSAMDEVLEDTGDFEWRGIELFWGRAPLK